MSLRTHIGQETALGCLCWLSFSKVQILFVYSVRHWWWFGQFGDVIFYSSFCIFGKSELSVLVNHDLFFCFVINWYRTIFIGNVEQYTWRAHFKFSFKLIPGFQFCTVWGWGLSLVWDRSRSNFSVARWNWEALSWHDAEKVTMAIFKLFNTQRNRTVGV